MLICGLKLTHDGAVAVIEDGKLQFSIEMEKLRNNPRFTGIEDTGAIADVLAAEGLSLDDIDVFAIDGWGGFNEEALAIQPRLEVGGDVNKLSAQHKAKDFQLNVAQYRERTLRHDVLQEWTFDKFPIGDKQVTYHTYLHVAGHIMGTYCTSPFAKRGESAYILAWDGGMFPRLYFFDASRQQIDNLGPIFLFIGNIYTIFAQHFGPYKVKGAFAKDNLSIAGKVMAYIALGEPRPELFPVLERITEEHYDHPMGFANVLANQFKEAIAGQGYSDPDILHTFHSFLEKMLIEKLTQKIDRYGRKSRNLCMTGGCALNIKWNSSVRAHEMFDEVYVPPFPNDSGSAIGAACCAMFHRKKWSALDWSVYSGPKLSPAVMTDGWHARPCELPELAALLHERGEPVVFLHGRAELGPRALGNRSILAPVSGDHMKDLLNRIKQREEYRPISPICLEDKAPAIFDPGTPDPFMLFDHLIREPWLDRIPAIRHLDKTARLQTINAEQNPRVATLLTEYEKLSGIPMLCNTSANYKGSGFFPDALSACEWDRVNYVWCEGQLYSRTPHQPL